MTITNDLLQHEIARLTTQLKKKDKDLQLARYHNGHLSQLLSYYKAALPKALRALEKFRGKVVKVGFYIRLELKNALLRWKTIGRRRDRRTFEV
jgi:hypothetical protein